MDEQITITVTEVRYSRLVSFGNYENEQIGATAAVPPGSDGTRELAALRLFVAQQLQAGQEREELRERVYQQRRELERLTTDVATMRERYNRAKTFVEGLGIATTDLRGFRF
jgi:hypothetical protein